MSAEPRNYDLNFEAANELVRQSKRASKILERLAAHLAAIDAASDREFKDLVESNHVIEAASLLFERADLIKEDSSPPPPSPNGLANGVFVSYSHRDFNFVSELASRLDAAAIPHFVSERDIQAASDWCDTLWDAIRACRVFLPILTPRFIRNRKWLDLECGAAIASRKAILPVLRYVDSNDVHAPLDRSQAVVVENEEQLIDLVESLKRMCGPPG